MEPWTRSSRAFFVPGNDRKKQEIPLADMPSWEVVKEQEVDQVQRQGKKKTKRYREEGELGRHWLELFVEKQTEQRDSSETTKVGRTTKVPSSSKRTIYMKKSEDWI